MNYFPVPCVLFHLRNAQEYKCTYFCKMSILSSKACPRCSIFHILCNYHSNMKQHLLHHHLKVTEKYVETHSRQTWNFLFLFGTPKLSSSRMLVSNSLTGFPPLWPGSELARNAYIGHEMPLHVNCKNRQWSLIGGWTDGQMDTG